MKEEKPLWKGFLDIETVFKVINICRENSIYYNIYTEEEILAEKLQYNLLFYHKDNMYKEKENRTNITIVNDMKEYIKMTICDDSELVFNNILFKLKKLENIEVLDTSFITRKVIKEGPNNVEISYYYTEISAKDVNKWRAIEKLKEILNIQRKEIMAIGDNINDIKMIENSGIGVAMGNSWDKVKLKADYVTKSNAEDGVSEAIEKFCDI